MQNILISQLVFALFLHFKLGLIWFFLNRVELSLNSAKSGNLKIIEAGIGLNLKILSLHVSSPNSANSVKHLEKSSLWRTVCMYRHYFLYLIISAHDERAIFELLYFKILGYFLSEQVKEFAQEKFLLGTDCFCFLPVFYRISHLKLWMRKTNQLEILSNVCQALLLIILLTKSLLNVGSSRIILCY